MTLFVFALNASVDVTLTDLTRDQGRPAGLPPLADWLGLDGLDTDRLELFPVADLGDLQLSSYLSSAYDADIGEAAARLNAIEGSVLLVPEHALRGTPQAGPEATLIATLPMPEPDHRVRLDPAPIPQPEPKALDPTQSPSAHLPRWIIPVALSLAVLIVWWLA